MGKEIEWVETDVKVVKREWESPDGRWTMQYAPDDECPSLRHALCNRAVLSRWSPWVFDDDPLKLRQDYIAKCREMIEMYEEVIAELEGMHDGAFDRPYKALAAAGTK